jgi:hypothetical protein
VNDTAKQYTVDELPPLAPRATRTTNATLRNGRLNSTASAAMPSVVEESSPSFSLSWPWCALATSERTEPCVAFRFSVSRAAQVCAGGLRNALHPTPRRGRGYAARSRLTIGRPADSHGLERPRRRKDLSTLGRDPLIRVVVLSNLLAKALEELDDGRFTSSKLLAELRDVGSRATEELNQFTSGRE